MKNCCNPVVKTLGNIKSPIDILKAVSEPNRLQILHILSKNNICVCEIAKKLGLAYNLVSFHLKTLSTVGILDKKRNGNQIFYFIRPEWENRIEYFFLFVDLK
jgi:DNA-binding transcriptional ArsR family regulator